MSTEERRERDLPQPRVGGVRGEKKSAKKKRKMAQIYKSGLSVKIAEPKAKGKHSISKAKGKKALAKARSVSKGPPPESVMAEIRAAISGRQDSKG